MQTPEGLQLTLIRTARIVMRFVRLALSLPAICSPGLYWSFGSQMESPLLLATSFWIPQMHTQRISNYPLKHACTLGETIGCSSLTRSHMPIVVLWPQTD